MRRQQKVSARNVASAPETDTQTGFQDTYRLRQKRQPRYKCGKYGLRDCVCILDSNDNREVPNGARGVPPEGRQDEDLGHRIVVRAEKTSTGVERTNNYSAESQCLRFKQWTSDGKGLETTLSTVVPLLPYIVFGPFNFVQEPVQTARCITADLIFDRYGVQVEPGGIYSPASCWGLLLSAHVLTR